MSSTSSNENVRSATHRSNGSDRVAHCPYSVPVIAFELMSPGTRRYYAELPHSPAGSPCELSPLIRSPTHSSVETSPISTPGRTESPPASVSTNDTLAGMTAADDLNVPITHNALRGRVPYMTLPAVPADNSTPSWTTRDPLVLSQQPRLFFGQVPLEMSMATLKHLIFQLTGVEAIRFDTRGFGCYLGYFSTTADSHRVKDMLNDQVLFDTHGVWFARNATEHAILRAYQPSLLRLTPFRLPRHMMSIRDEANSTPSYHQHGAHRGAGGNMRQQQQQQQQQHFGTDYAQDSIGGIPQPKRRAKMQQVLHKFHAAQQQQQQQEQQQIRMPPPYPAFY